MTDLTPLALAGVFASVALLTGAIMSLVLSRSTTERRRVRELVDGPKDLVALPELLPLSQAGPGGVWGDLEKMLPRSRKEMERLRQRTVRAGIKLEGAPVLFSVAELLLPVLLGGLALMSGLMQPPMLWIVAAGIALLGFLLPGLWLERQMSARRREIENGLPDALDLMVVCIEAGSGLDQAIVKTSDELYFTYPALGEELRILNAEIRGGKTRIEAFKGLAQRTKVEDIRALTAILIQTDKFGTSIGQALRTHSDTSRTKRRQRAEEAAQKIGVKLVFPLVLFFFPALYAVILGPAVIQFVHEFMN
jgi:tight adherence protein C